MKKSKGQRPSPVRCTRCFHGAAVATVTLGLPAYPGGLEHALCSTCLKPVLDAIHPGLPPEAREAIARRGAEHAAKLRERMNVHLAGLATPGAAGAGEPADG